MAFSISASAGNLAISTSYTLPSSYSTKAGDVVMLGIGSANSNWTGVTVSGLGATWIVKSLFQGNGNLFAIGYNCSAGQTTITVSSNPSTSGGAEIVVWSGLSTAAPTQLFATNTATQAVAITVTGLSWNAGQLCVAYGQAYTFANYVDTWNGVNGTNAATGNALRQSYINYYLPSTSVSGVSYVSPAATGANAINGLFGFTFNAAPSHNNLLLMNAG